MIDSAARNRFRRRTAWGGGVMFQAAESIMLGRGGNPGQACAEFLAPHYAEITDAYRSAGLGY